jgi:hypothetical protein
VSSAAIVRAALGFAEGGHFDCWTVGTVLRAERSGGDVEADFVPLHRKHRRQLGAEERALAELAGHAG